MVNLKLIFYGSFAIWLMHYLWKNVPYTVLFKHLTLNEYTIRKYYVHTIMLSTLSNPDDLEFLISLVTYFTSVAYKAYSNKLE